MVDSFLGKRDTWAMHKKKKHPMNSNISLDKVKGFMDENFKESYIKKSLNNNLQIQYQIIPSNIFLSYYPTTGYVLFQGNGAAAVEEKFHEYLNQGGWIDYFRNYISILKKIIFYSISLLKVIYDIRNWISDLLK